MSLQVVLLSVLTLSQLRQIGKPTWHPYNFGKTRKIAPQQFGKPTWQNRKLAKLTSPRAYMRARIVVAIVVSL
jgi:hypothetical protein